MFHKTGISVLRKTLIIIKNVGTVKCKFAAVWDILRHCRKRDLPILVSKVRDAYPSDTKIWNITPLYLAVLTRFPDYSGLDLFLHRSELPAGDIDTG